MNKNENMILQFMVSRKWFRKTTMKELKEQFQKTWNTLSEAAKLLENKGLITRENGYLKLDKSNKANYYFKFFIDRLRIKNLDERVQFIISETYSNAEFITPNTESRLISLLIFGSVASGETNKKSDIDLLIIIKDPGDKEKLQTLKNNIITQRHIRFGGINIITMSDKEFERGYLDGDDFIIGILLNNLLYYDDGYLWVFMQRDLFLPSRKIIYTKIKQLENDKLRLLDLIKEGINDDELKNEFYDHLIREARLVLLRRKMMPMITKKDVINKIEQLDINLYNEIKNIDKNNIRDKVIKYVSSRS